MSKSERRVLKEFRLYLMSPGQMLCFDGQTLHKHRAALQALTERDLLVKERFHGAYSLTRAGFLAMKNNP